MHISTVSSHTCTDKHRPTHSYAHTHPYTLTQTHTHSHTLTQTHTHSHTLTPTHSHTHTNSHTHSLLIFPNMAHNGEDSNSKSAEFTTKLGDIVTKGFVTIGLAVGQHTGLFRSLIHLGGPATAADIAKEADCNLRYVLLWRHLLTTVTIVTVYSFILP